MLSRKHKRSCVRIFGEKLVKSQDASTTLTHVFSAFRLVDLATGEILLHIYISGLRCGDVIRETVVRGFQGVSDITASLVYLDMVQLSHLGYVHM